MEQSKDFHKGDFSIWKWVAIVLGGVFLGVWLGVQPLLDAAERLALATEKKRIQAAIEAYHMLARVPEIPCRSVPRRILPHDADAPFARFLERPTRYAYRWFEGGHGVHAVGKEEIAFWPLLAVTALTEEIASQKDEAATSVWEGVGQYGDWQERLYILLQRHIQAGNAMGLLNPISGSDAIVRNALPTGGMARAPAVLITDVPLYMPRYLSRNPNLGLAGTIVVLDGDNIRVFMVGRDGRPHRVQRISASPVRP